MALKPLICPQCSGEVVLDKDQEFGFCKYCGTKIQNDNIVKVKGKVKIDNSDYVENCLKNARRSLEQNDWEEVEKYYDLVKQNAPENSEAIFYSSYGKTMLALCDESSYNVRKQKLNILCKDVSAIAECFDTPMMDNHIKVIVKINRILGNMFKNTFALDEKDYEICSNFITSLSSVVDKIDVEKNRENLILLYKILINNLEFIYPTHHDYYYLLNDTYTKLHEIDPDFEIPQIITEDVINNNKHLSYYLVAMCLLCGVSASFIFSIPILSLFSSILVILLAREYYNQKKILDPKIEHNQKNKTVFICSDCGREVSSTESFCPYCGKNLEVVKEKKKETIFICSDCGKEVSSFDQFCPHCGHAFDYTDE